MSDSDKELAFNFQCSKQWNELDESADETVRFCSRCNKPVFLARNTKELAELARQKHCAAIRRECGQGHQVGYPGNSIVIGEPVPEPHS